MKDPDKDKTHGKADQVLGKIKETAGRAVGNKKMESEGKSQQAEGDVKETKGKVKDKVEDGLNSHGSDKDTHASNDHSDR